MTLAPLRRAALLALIPLLSTCGGPSTPAPIAVATPTPAAPVPSPSPTPVAFACPYPALPDLHNTCPKLTPQLDRYVNNAVEAVIAKRPELFDFNDSLGVGSYKVKDRQKYIDAVVSAIHDQGICAKDDKEEVAVKNSNLFNEQYNVWTSSGYVRRAYITTCVPAQF